MLLISNRFLGNIGLKNIAERDLVYVNGLSVPAQNTNGHNSQSIHRLSFRISLINFLCILVCIDNESDSMEINTNNNYLFPFELFLFSFSRLFLWFIRNKLNIKGLKLSVMISYIKFKYCIARKKQSESSALCTTFKLKRRLTPILTHED